VQASDRVTIADVAGASGVGIGTVSRVINGAANVRQATRAKVLKVIEQLGYRPSHLATALSRGTSRTVAIVVPHVTRPSTVERLAGALAVLAERGYATIVCNVDTASQRDQHLAALTARHRADGVIVMSLALRPDHLTSFRRANVPLVTVDLAARSVPHTIIDDVAGGRLAAEHLLALGHARIGFIGDRARRGQAATVGCTSSERRRAGLYDALRAAGIGVDPSLTRLGPHGPASAEAMAAELLAMPEPPTAIFAASDTQAIGVLAAADRLGVRVPHELSIIGFDDIEPASLLRLSTVREPLQESGAEGARRLCALLRGERVLPLRQVLAIEVVQRGSSGRPAGQSRRTSCRSGSHSSLNSALEAR